MATNSVSELDEKVFEVVRNGHVRLGTIAAFANLNDRVVDRALQRLRKKRRVTFVTKTGWVVV